MGEMGILAESLRRLYTDRRITLEDVQNLLNKGKIDQTKYDFITAVS